MFLVVVNNMVVARFKNYGDAYSKAMRCKAYYTQKPTVTIEDKRGFLIEAI